MNRFGRYLLLLLILFLQVTVMDRIRMFGAKPDTMLIYVVFFGLFFGSGIGLETGIAAGLLQDLFALDFFGINTLILGITGLLAGALNTKFFRESRMTQSLLVLFFTAFSILLHYAVVSNFLGPSVLRPAEYILFPMLPACVYTGLLSLAAFPVLMGMYGLREPEDFL